MGFLSMRFHCVGRLALVVMSASFSVAMGGSPWATPDFSGRWIVATQPAPGSRGEMGSGWGPAVTITQDSQRLTVEYAFFGRGDMQPPLKFVYALDGSET